MGRRAEGWRLRRRPEPDGPFFVRFTYKGHRFDLTTGTRDPREAGERAPVIFAREAARVDAGKLDAPKVVADSTDTRDLFALWLEAIENTHAETTQEVMSTYVKAHFAKAFKTVADFTAAKLANFMRERLGKALRDTVRKELRALGSFFRWAKEQSYIADVPQMPVVPANATGTRTGTRKAQPTELAPEHATALLPLMPEWSSERDDAFPVASYFRVLWETGLRPSTLQRLSVPENFRKGEGELRITEEVDKIRYARNVPITVEAREALDRVAPEKGLIFGKHDWRDFVNEAARKAGVPLADDLSPYDMRHGRITQWAETGNLPGTAFLVGHKRVTTTNRYAKPNARAARAVLGAFSGAGSENVVGAIGFEPTTPTVSSTWVDGNAENSAGEARQESAGNDQGAPQSGAAAPEDVRQLLGLRKCVALESRLFDANEDLALQLAAGEEGG